VGLVGRIYTAHTHKHTFPEEDFEQVLEGEELVADNFDLSRVK